MASPLTPQQLNEFHSIDRQIYARLLFGLSLDSNLAKKIVAFWYWLETKGFRNFIKNTLLLPNTLLSGFAMEAETCLHCLNSEGSVADFIDLDKNIPLMRYLVNQDFSLGKVYADREKGLRVMERLEKNVFERVFNDIVPINLAENGCYIQTLMANHGFQAGFQGQILGHPEFEAQPMVSSSVQVPAMMANGVQVPVVMVNGRQVQTLWTNGVQGQPTVVYGAQVQTFLTNGVQGQPAVVYGAQVLPVLANGVQVHDPVTNGVQIQALMANGVEVQAQVQPLVANEAQIHDNGSGQEDSRSQDSSNVTQNLASVSNHDRTLFVTFSKGLPTISKAELKELITREFGNCVESIHMRHEPPPLFALVVLKSASALATVLGENDLVKLCSNGKDVWARRFVPKQDEQPLLSASS